MGAELHNVRHNDTMTGGKGTKYRKLNNNNAFIPLLYTQPHITRALRPYNSNLQANTRVQVLSQHWLVQIDTQR